jgi:hypothetical protein
MVPVGGGTELDVVVDRGLVSRDQHMEMLYREMDSRLTFRGNHSAFVIREELRGREKMTLDAAVTFAPEFARKAMLILSDVCLFVDGVARPGVTLRDFAPEDIESVEFYGGVWRNLLGNAGRALQQTDPTGSLVTRWPGKIDLTDPSNNTVPCGQPLTPGEGAASKTNVKVAFALIWLRK